MGGSAQLQMTCFGQGHAWPSWATIWLWALVVAATSVITIQPVGAGQVLVLVFTLFLVGVVAYANFSSLLILLLALVCFFPEYSQTEWNVLSAEDAPSLYNYRPIRAITASAFDYLFALIVAVWAKRHVWPDPRRLWRVPLAPWMLGFLGVCAASLAYGLLRGNETYYALREFRVSACFALAYLMVATAIRSDRGLRRILRLGWVMALGIGVHGVIRFMVGIGKEFADVRLVFYDLADSIILYIAMLCCVCAALAGRVRGWSLMPVVLAVLPMLFAFVFSFRRGAWVAFGAGLLFLFAFPPAWKHRPFRLSAGLLLLACFAAVLLLADATPAQFVWERMLSIADTTEDSSNVFRIFDAFNAFNTFLQNPVFGVGFGGRYEILYYSEAAGPREFMEQVSKSSHNGYLFILMKMGLVGFFVYMAILAKFFARWYRHRKSIPSGPYRVLFFALGAAFVSLLVNNMTNPVSDSLRPALLLAFVMGLASATLACAQRDAVLLKQRLAVASLGAERNE